MKGKLSLVVASVLLSSSVALATDTKDKQIEMLLKRLDKVETELASLKADTTSQIDELHLRADDNELQAALSKVKFGLEFETNVHSFDGTLKGKNVDSSNKWNGFLNLNMDAAINEKTTFTGRLAMAKNWADDTIGFPDDTAAGRTTTGGSTVYVERAYIDYKFTDSIIMTLGRQPGTDGPGTNLKNNAKRQSTYPAMLFNAAGDGLVFSFKPKIDGLEKTVFRAGYAKAYQWDSGSGSTDIVGDASLNDSNIWLGMAETKLPLGDMGENLLTLSGAMSPDFSIPAGSPIGRLTVGDITLANLYFENNNAFGSGFSWFSSLGYSKGSGAKDNSTAINNAIYNAAYSQTSSVLSLTGPLDNVAYNGMNNAQQATAVANGAVAANGTSTIVATSLNEESGWAILVGGRYDFTKEFKLGYEFFHGSQYWYSFTSGNASDPLNKLNTRGNAHDIYGIYQLDLNQYFRLSYTTIKYNYTNSGSPVGGAVKTDDKVDHWMLTYNVKF